MSTTRQCQLRIGAQKADWMESAACRDNWPVFDATYRDGLPAADQCRMTVEEAAAIEICRTQCPVRNQCLEWALAIGDNAGVLGGAASWQRILIQKRRAA